MAKKRQIQKGADHKADTQLRSQKKAGGTNRFELKFNKSKHAVVGKGILKQAAGVPSVSRKKSEENRKKTLLVEYERRVKFNTVIDKRLSERDTKIGADEKLAKRYVLQHKKSLSGKLKEADAKSILTHGGVSVADIERHDRPINDDNDNEQIQALTAEFVTGAHFGGGDLDSKYNGYADESLRKSRKDLISELITKTRSLRAAKQLEREEMLNMTDKLDAQWKELAKDGLIGAMVGGDEPREAPKNNDDYDELVRELQFENKRSKAGEKSKSAEEIAKMERDRLEKLEEERINRMQALNTVPVADKDSDYDSETDDNKFIEKPKQPKHVSADDDFDCNLHFGSKNKEDPFMVQYSNGKLMNEDKLDNLEERVEDVDESSEESDLDVEELKPASTKSSNKKEKLEEKGESVDSDIPFVFSMPANYSEFSKLMVHENKSVVLTRLIKCFHPKLNNKNRLKLKRLFLYALRYFDFIASTAMEDENAKSVV